MKIVSVFVNNPMFIELQYNSIKKFFKCDNEYEIIIFNDAKDWPDITNFNDITIKEQINNTCNRLNIPCINIPNSHHMKKRDPSARHADSVNFITKYMLTNPDIYFMLDSDMFFVDYFDIKEFEQYYFCYINQCRNIGNSIINYPWPNFFYLDINNIPNKELIDWYPGNGLDSGGKCAYWLSKLEKKKILEIKHLYSCSWNENDIPENININLKLFLNNDVRNKNGKYFSELYHKKILHYRAASNWMNESFEMHNSMSKLLYETLSKLL
jgi:hypothetical protein